MLRDKSYSFEVKHLVDFLIRLEKKNMLFRMIISFVIFICSMFKLKIYFVVHLITRCNF